MTAIQKLVPNLWFDSQAEEAVKFYIGVFKNSKVEKIARYGKEGFEIHGRKEGSVMTIEFILDGQQFIALNGGPHFKFTEAISFVINCNTQQEIDYYWDKLSAGGDPKAQECGWLKDQYGLSWQVVPTIMSEMMIDSDKRKSERVVAAMLKMKKLDIEALQKAYDGEMQVKERQMSL